MPPLTPEQSAYAWDSIKAMAHDIRVTGEMAEGLPPLDPDSEEYLLIDSGVALGIAAAAQFYKDNPAYVPSDEDD